MCSSNPPPAPNYTAAAESTAEADLDLAKQTTLANRPDEITPYGSRTWERTPGEDVFDEAGYQTALEQYNKDVADLQGSFGTSNVAYGQERAAIDALGGIPSRGGFTTNTGDQWRSTISLSPEQQELFNKNILTDQGLADLGLMGIDQAKDVFGSRFNIEGDPTAYQGPEGSLPGYQGPEGSMPTYGENRQNVVNAMMSRVNTDIGRDRDAKEAQLISQGIPKGSEAFDREMENLDRKQTDARQQAEIAATTQAGQDYASALAGRSTESREAMDRFGTGVTSRGIESQEGMADYTTGLDTRRQSIQEALLNRQTPLNEISAFRTGSQISAPQFQAYGMQGQSSAPNYLGATQQQGQYDMNTYNAEQAQRNAIMSGLFGLGAAGIGA